MPIVEFRIQVLQSACYSQEENLNAPILQGRGAFLSDERNFAGNRLQAPVFASQMADLREDPDQWRKRADEARKLADGLTDPEAKHVMMTIAEMYETLARRAVQRAWPKDPDAPGSDR